jgi:hypothetical protein
MSKVSQTLKDHPVAIVFSILYGSLWWDYLNVHHKLEVYRMRGESTVSYGEGVAYTMLFILLFGFIFTLATLINAVFEKGQRTFYLILSLLIILPAVIFVLKYGI